MREVPKVNTTTSIMKVIEGTGLIAHPKGKNVLNTTMDNPQTVPKLAMIRAWNMSQRLPARWLKHLISADDAKRYSLFLYESIGRKVLATLHFNSIFM